MVKEICSYCDEEKNKSEMTFNYAMDGLICGKCRIEITARFGRQKKPKNYDKDDE